MEVGKFEALVKKVETLKATFSKTQGTIEATEKQMKELGVDDPDTTQEVIDGLRKECEDIEKENDKDYDELKGLYSWQFV